MGNKRAYNEKIRDKKGVRGKMCREISKMEKCMTGERIRTTKKALTTKWRNRDGECVTRNSRRETIHAGGKICNGEARDEKTRGMEHTVKTRDWKIRCENFPTKPSSVFPTGKDARQTRGMRDRDG